MQSEKTRMNVYLDRHLKERLDRIADKERRSTSAQVAIILERSIKKHFAPEEEPVAAAT